MRDYNAPKLEDSHPRDITPSISRILNNLYARVTAPRYIHDANPWDESDPALQSISTASLELLQDHAVFHMKAFLYVHDLLDRELVDRKLVSRTRLTRKSNLLSTLPNSSSISEVLFDIEDLEPLSSFLGPPGTSGNPCGAMPAERIETMVKMAYAWVDGDRSASARRRAGSKPTPIRSQGPRNSAIEARAETGEDGESGKEDQCVEDVMELTAQMDEFDQVDDNETFPELESTTSR